MRIVKLRTRRANDFWFLDNIKLTPFEDTSPPFDLDEVYPEAKEYINRSLRVTERIELIDISNTREELIEIVRSNEPHFELPGQPHMHIPREIIASVEVDDNSDEVVIADQNDESYKAIKVDKTNSEKERVIPPSRPEGISIISAEDKKRANKLLACKVDKIESALDILPENKETRRFLFACISAERKRKKRKSVLGLLEEKFLAIPPEGD